MKKKALQFLPPPNILFIDDNRANNFLVETIIKMDKIPVIPHFETDAISAITYLKRLKRANYFPDLIFVDINMPGKSGFDFIADFMVEFPEYQKDTDIYILTTSITVQDLEQANNFKIIKTCLEKPLESNQLKKIIGLPTEE